jgi:hypothetical protein
MMKKLQLYYDDVVELGAMRKAGRCLSLKPQVGVEQPRARGLPLMLKIYHLTLQKIRGPFTKNILTINLQFLFFEGSFVMVSSRTGGGGWCQNLLRWQASSYRKKRK